MGLKWRDELRLAAAAPRWSWRFYLRHLPLVGGLSLIPSVQRLVVVGSDGQLLPGWLNTTSEVVVMGVRVLLVVLVWRIAFAGARPDWNRARAFVDTHWRGLVCQSAFLVAAFGFFGVFAEQVVGGLLPESAQQTYLAVLLFVKNPTVIAFTMVWVVGAIRQAALPVPATAAPVPAR
ncbi:hypothetical protein [Actinophytocola gossypii]|uniref:Uncharacterized protein n=1 Tax=Actinophytocola gossypii TaxID=2812003 RepID=A0ABT2JFX6_9PSEU|nr:hypothetical protein [Actinophytocola gossypii]MCT2586330.1 hypothetical protein [Actinophytocola gossypii]